MFKLGAMDAIVHGIVSKVLRAKGAEPGPEDELEDLLPEDGDLEAVVATLEENFGVHLPEETTFALFAQGRVKHLEKAILQQLVLEKTADHRYYMQHRAQIQQKNRQYRMRNLHMIRRRARIYRRKVKRHQVRPRRRVGTRAGGYTFIRQ